MRKTILLCCIFYFSVTFTNVYSFPLTPRITNYSVHEYQGGNQNWSVTQDNQGRIYFGNNKGVLEYDGINWRLYPLPSNDIVRCVYYSSDNRLYAGSYEEFGYFIRDDFNQLQYISLKGLLGDFSFKNEEIWNILEYSGKVYFQYFSTYFEYDGRKEVKVYKGFPPLNMFIYDNKIFSQRINGNLSVYKNGDFKPVLNREKYGNDDIIRVLPIKDKSLLFTRNQGIFVFNPVDSTTNIWRNEINEDLKSSSINKVILMKDSAYVIGTLSNGVYALDNDGKLLWKLDSGNGLMNNTVLGLYCDSENNVWVGLDNGLAKIYSNSNLYTFDPTPHHIGMVYDVLIGDNVSYIASNQGLYYYQENTGALKIVSGSEGQTWSISNIDGQIICGHNTGSFLIEGEKVSPLSSVRGARNIIKCTINNQEILLQNTYTFLNIYRKDQNGKWYYSNRVEKFLNLIEHVEIDHLGNIWAGHMHRGIFRLKLNENLTEVEDIEFFDTLHEKKNLKINVFKISGRIIFTGENGFYIYDDISKKIVPYEKLNEDLPSLKNSYNVVQRNSSEYWFIGDKNYSLVKFFQNRYNVIYQISLSVFDNPPIDGRGNVFITKGKEVYLALNGALIKYIDESRLINDSLAFKLDIREISVSDNSGANSFYLPVNRKSRISYENNNIRISLFCPAFREKSLNVRYRLDGLDEAGLWYENMENLQKEYSRLPYGEYTFRVKLYDSQDSLSEINYSFIIERPYYLSYLAIVIYIILGVAGIIFIVYSVYNYTSKKKNRQIQEQKRQHEIELEHQQKQIIELEKEQLTSELRFKSKELANFTMMSIKNKEFLIHIKEELQKQQEKGHTPKQFFNNIIRIIDENITSDDDWALFQSNFDRIHENFFRNLKERYPDLTPNDLRLCALLRLNLSTKDISNMMNISLRGIEAARYRLRKRLNIPSEQDLTDFMIRFR
ncbi:helix-turn-helix and ligand-binding sensor domain-containing protein [Dysgonomonas reticulitermitis]